MPPPCARSRFALAHLSHAPGGVLAVPNSSSGELLRPEKIAIISQTHTPPLHERRWEVRLSDDFISSMRAPSDLQLGIPGTNPLKSSSLGYALTQTACRLMGNHRSSEAMMPCSSQCVGPAAAALLHKIMAHLQSGIGRMRYTLFATLAGLQSVYTFRES
jgi:hypothetical protein